MAQERTVLSFATADPEGQDYLLVTRPDGSTYKSAVISVWSQTPTNSKIKNIVSTALKPIVETPYNSDIDSDSTNSEYRISAKISGTNTAGNPASGYSNSVDLTQYYAFIHNESGWNQTTDNNNGRTGIYAHRVKLIQDGQGDLVAYNASIRVRAQKEGATHWLASPAGVLINGTVIAEANGVYLNPRELYLTDKPNDVAYNCTTIGDVVNMNRNHISDSKANGGIGQVWVGYKAQSVGAAYVDNILCGTGKFFGGIDLSMPALDFGVNKSAILLKAFDRIQFNAIASEVDNSNEFIRANHRATSGFSDYMYYDSTALRFKIVVGGNETLQVSNGMVTVSKLFSNDDITLLAGKKVLIGSQTLLGARSTGFTRMVGAADKVTAFDVATVTLQQLAARVKAIEDALHLGGGFNGILGS